jgi:peptide deformylase
MKTIIHTPHKVLITPAQKVGKIDKKILQSISELKEVLIAADEPKGVGLAAPQIGLALQIFLLRPEETDPIRVFINPEFVSKSRAMVKGIPGDDNRIEGCLSVPHVWGLVKRHESVTIRFTDEESIKQEETFSGFAATIVQHEMDHLEGILFTRRVIEQKGQLYKPGIDDDGKEILEPLEL